MMVIKRNGSSEPFMPAKIVLSMIRNGVPAGYAQTIARNIERTARDGITTGEIRIKALCMLRAGDPDWMKTESRPVRRVKETGSWLTTMPGPDISFRRLSRKVVKMETPENRIPVLIKELSHRNKDVRWAAAVSLSRIGKPAVEPLIAALDDRDSVVRLRAAWALGRIGDGRAAGKLVRTLLDGDWAVRMRAADALGALRAPEATDHLLLLLRDRNADVRRHAIAALTKIADPAAADRLGDTLKDPDWRVRMGAALALAAIGDDKSRGYLRTVSCDENEYVRTVALSSLKPGEGDSCRKTVKLGLAKDLPEGSMKGVRAGTLDLLLAHPDTGICAIGNTCTHQGCRLSTGTLEGSTVHCPCHGSAFDVKTGEVVNGPAKTPVPSYPVVLENGEITLSL